MDFGIAASGFSAPHLLRYAQRAALLCARYAAFIAMMMGWVLSLSAHAQTPAAPSPLLAQVQDALPQVPRSLDAAEPRAMNLRQLPLVELGLETDHIRLLPQTEYWVDDSLDTTVDALVARSSAGQALFRPSSETDRHKVDGKVLWLRFEIMIADPRSHWLLQLDSPLVDDVQLYWRDAKQQWLVLKAGDVVPHKNWPMQTRLPTFSLKSGAGISTVYYLRIVNKRTPVSLPMQIYRDTHFVAAQQADSLLLGALLGLVALVLVVSAFMALAMRDRAFAAFAAYNLPLGLFMMTNVGLSTQYLWPDSPILADRMNYVFACCVAALGPWLAHMILQPREQRRFWKITTTLLATVMLICAIAELLMPNSLSYKVMNIGTLVAIVVVYGLVGATWKRGEELSRWIALCFAPVALSALPLILRNAGLITNGWYTQYNVLLAASIELPLLLYALLIRSFRRRESHARMAGLPKQDALTGLPNTRNLLEQMQGSITRANRFSHQYGLILIHLSNHDWFIKEHGQDMADRAVILASNRLQTVMRDVDCVCRIDRAHFVMLVEGHCSAGFMTKMTARIAASGHQPTNILPVGATLKLVITCALMPTADSREAGDDASAQLGWLIAAAENMPLEGRKTLRTLGF
jgi:two-component system, sensor histidine kinase LadS